MLTRLRVRGFKNLRDVDIRFGPFTCIAGMNGVGKSNIFDAIVFLRELSHRSFVEAANEVRGGADVRSLFTADGENEMTFEADMLIPRQGLDEYGQHAEASSTFVQYAITLKLRPHTADLLHDEIELVSESLTPIRKGRARDELGFPNAPAWRNGVVHADRHTAFITSETETRLVKLHQDKTRRTGPKKGGGRSREYHRDTLPRTVLSSARNAQESPTAVLARQEMQSWRLLQLEPTALRCPDDFRAPDRLATNGAHVPAALYRLALASDDGLRVYTTLSNRLAELIEGVKLVGVDKDENRRLLTLYLEDLQGVRLSASSLSDGTLRFLALSVLAMDPRESGVICMEEPENGIHPQRIRAILTLLRDISVDPHEEAGDDNPLRQVIVNTHSPVVAKEVDEDALLFAESVPLARGEMSLLVRCLPETWRDQPGAAAKPISMGAVLSYLGSAGVWLRDPIRPPKRPRRVEETVQQMLLNLQFEAETDPSRERGNGAGKS